jgi:phosphoenolpyruvate synthase/pyruvate phosphate dikinase
MSSQRRNDFFGYSEVYTFYIDGRSVNAFPSETGLIKGTGTRPGRATGPVRILDDPTKGDVKKGNILIAKNIDPGWTPVLRTTGGIAVEEGGMLNHCSIIVREIGIPAIVGVLQATKKIPQGTIVTIDGGLGIIQMAEGNLH